MIWSSVRHSFFVPFWASFRLQSDTHESDEYKFWSKRASRKWRAEERWPEQVPIHMLICVFFLKLMTSSPNKKFSVSSRFCVLLDILQVQNTNLFVFCLFSFIESRKQATNSDHTRGSGRWSKQCRFLARLLDERNLKSNAAYKIVENPKLTGPAQASEQNVSLHCNWPSNFYR